MKNLVTKAGIPLVIIIVAVVIAVGMIASRKPPEQKEVEQKAFLVDTTATELRDLNFVVHSQGTVRPKFKTILSAQVSGKVVEVADVFIEGGMFVKGQVLVQLEKADFVTDLKSAEAELARAQAALEEEQARGKVAAQEWRSVNNTVAPELGLRKPQLAKEMATVRAAEAQLERAKRNLQRTRIKAPYDGLVKSKLVDIGQFVGVGSQLGELYNTDVAEVRMPLTDNDLAYLDLTSDSQPAEVSLQAKVAGKAVSWQAKLARDEGVLDERSRVIYAIAEVQDPYQRKAPHPQPKLKFGRFVTAQIAGSKGENLVVLPRSVLRFDGTVLTVDDDRKLRIKPVQVQRTDEDFVYISSGLASGERVATSVIPNPVEGMQVRLPGDDTNQSEQSALAKAGVTDANH